MLTKLAYQVDAAVDGCAAVDEVEKKNYDLVVVHANSPGADRSKLIYKLRHDELTKSTPIIAITDLDSSDRKLFINAGFDDCLIMPVEIESLKTIVERWITPASESISG